MTGRPLRNIAASVHQRLLNKARETGRPFGETLQYYGMERFMYRLSKTPLGGNFVLKGALMFLVWRVHTFRPTMDIDLLGRYKNDIEGVCDVMRGACNQDVEPDGMVFDASSVTGARIAEDAEYEGIRVSFRGALGNARLFLQIDMGFGDVISPGAQMAEYPTILEYPAPRLWVYSRESSVAEKLHAMVKHDLLNSRMKDFYDIWLLSRQFDFDGGELAQAIRATFEHRETDIPPCPVAFTSAFHRDEAKSALWKSFLRKSRLDTAPQSLEEVVLAISEFLCPVANALARKEPFAKRWKAGGAWAA